jgi:hypothetical protein
MPYNDLQQTVLLTMLQLVTATATYFIAFCEAKSITGHKWLSSIGFMLVLLFSDW